MTYQLVNNGDVPDEDYFNDALMRQTIVKCTSGTRPSSPDEGMTVHETDTNMRRFYNGTKWVSNITAVPGVVVSKGTASITNNSLTTISWDSELSDPFNMWSSGSGITIPYAGVWIVGLSIRWASQTTAAGLRGAQIYVNGAEANLTYTPMTSSFNSTNVMTSLVHPMVLAASDVLDGRAFQTSGGALNLISPTRMWAYLQVEV